MPLVLVIAGGFLHVRGTELWVALPVRNGWWVRTFAAFGCFVRGKDCWVAAERYLLACDVRWERLRRARLAARSAGWASDPGSPGLHVVRLAPRSACWGVVMRRLPSANWRKVKPIAVTQ